MLPDDSSAMIRSLKGRISDLEGQNKKTIDQLDVRLDRLETMVAFVVGYCAFGTSLVIGFAERWNGSVIFFGSMVAWYFFYVVTVKWFIESRPRRS